MAPTNFEEYVGQEHLVSESSPLRQLIDQDKLVSLILWGPPGVGKTALSRLIASITEAHYLALNAVTSSVSDLRAAIKEAKDYAALKTRTLLFIDEIHRFNKSQQDALLADVESGLITLIGATTENPYFSVNASLISRSQVYELKSLSESAMLSLFERGQAVCELGPISDEMRAFIIDQSNGDARRLYNVLEACEVLVKQNEGVLSEDLLRNLLSKPGYVFDQTMHYDLISAFIKSMRGSDPQASVYWLARLLESGEDPRFIARRLLIFASEDVGNADPVALSVASSAVQAVQFLGLPEAELSLSQATLYLATAPKSNASTVAINRAKALIRKGGVYEVPDALKDAHYSGAKASNRGKDYKYPHDYPYGIVKQSYIPKTHPFYEPVERGFERTIKKRMEWIENENFSD